MRWVALLIPLLRIGAVHGSETMLLFGVPLPENPVTDSVRENMIDLWALFAKTGDPNGGMNVTWPKYTEHGAYLDIGAVSTVK